MLKAKQTTGLVIGGIVVLSFMILAMTFGINNNGYRQVVQWPNGNTFTKFEPGVYFTLFGTATQYPDVITFDYDDIQDDDSSLQEQGMQVRYQDGGTGTVYGKDRFVLPTDEKTMLELHRAFRSQAGVANKLLRPVVKEAHQLTAGLLTSEGAYAEQRGTYIEWTKDQINNGKYAQVLQDRTTIDTVTGKKTIIKFPVIKMENGVVVRAAESDLATYGIRLASSQITNWDFEAKTLQQIAEKRKATMAIITARAEAEKAKQDAITAEATGKANVMKAKYEKEVEKERAVVVAQQQAEVAVIAAAKLVSVAEQQKLEAEQKKFAAAEYKKEQILRGQGDGEYRRLVMAGDGYALQKIEAYKEVAPKIAAELAKQKWTPEFVAGGGGAGNATETYNGVKQLVDLKVMEELGIDITLAKTKMQRKK